MFEKKEINFPVYDCASKIDKEFIKYEYDLCLDVLRHFQVDSIGGFFAVASSLLYCHIYLGYRREVVNNRYAGALLIAKLTSITYQYVNTEKTLVQYSIFYEI